MKTTLRNGFFALIMAVVFSLPQANSVQAASWHAPSFLHWTIDPICRNGVKITMRWYAPALPDDPGPSRTIAYAAYSPTTLLGAPSQPKRMTGLPEVGRVYGQVSVTSKPRRPPLAWTDDDNGMQGLAYNYGIGVLRWNLNRPENPNLAIGVPVVVRWKDGNKSSYFLGRVNDCLLP